MDVHATAGLLERPVFSVGGRELSWADVVAAAERSGAWESLRRRAAEGLAALGRVEVAEAEEEAAAARFRYERNLVAGEEMEAWLAHWDVGVRDWRAFLRRSLARERLAAAEADVDVDERVLWAEAVCSGELAHAARELAARLAAAESVGEPDPDRALERLRERAVTDAALTSLIAVRPADWVRVECRTLLLPDENAAREAALCVRDDGMALAEVAAQAGAELAEQRLLLRDADAAFAEALLSSRAGELLGPLPAGERFVLVLVEDKVDPSLDDLELRQRAEQEAWRRAVEREVANRVRWHEPL